MFRSRRAGLVRRLWRQRCPVPGADEGPGALKPAAHALFKKLKDEELELLVQAVESRGAWESSCVWAPRGDPRGGPKQPLPPQLLLCRLYRWPDLRQPHELKHLCHCAGGRGGCGDAAALCCNPHHFSRLAVPGECRRDPSSQTHPTMVCGGASQPFTPFFLPTETPPPPYSKASWPDEPQRPGTALWEFSCDWHGKGVPPVWGGHAPMGILFPTPRGTQSPKIGEEERLRCGARGPTPARPPRPASHCGSCYFWRRRAPRRRKRCPRGHTQCALTHTAAAPAWPPATEPPRLHLPHAGTPGTALPYVPGRGSSGKTHRGAV